MYGYGLYGFYSPYGLLLLVAIILAMVSSYNVNRNFRKYSQINNRTGMSHIRIEPVGGDLTDHYDHRKEIIRLSENVMNGKSISAVSIAAHEAGHALQKQHGYVFFKFRDALATPVSFASRTAWILIFVGFLLERSNSFTGSYIILELGIIMFAVTTLFHIVTLPVEIDASKRALVELEKQGIIFREEKSGVKKVLGAAAMTYVAALAVSVIQLLRLLAIRGRN